MNKVGSFRIEFVGKEGQTEIIDVRLQSPICSSCGQDHKMNVEMNIWDSPHGPCTKTRHPNFKSAYAAAKKRFPQLP